MTFIIHEAVPPLEVDPRFDPGPYTVNQSAKEQVFFFTAPQTSFTLKWFTVEPFQTVTTSTGHLPGHFTASNTITGNDVEPILGGYGHTVDLTIDTSKPFDALSFTDAVGSFTFQLEQPYVPSAPEPSTWLMLLMGFGCLMLVGARRRALNRVRL